MPYSKIPAFAHLTHSDAQGRSREGCHEPNPALSRIWIHLVRLEGNRGYFLAADR